MRDHWTPENPNTPIPRPRADRKRLLYSTFVENGSYIRLQTLALGYQLPAAMLPRGATARLYVTGQNLWLGTDYSGFQIALERACGARVFRALDLSTTLAIA